MAAPDLYRLPIQPIHAAGVEYMITGAAAAIAYGEPRMTNDVDLVVRPGPDTAALLHHAFSEADYCVPPIEAIEEEIRRDHSGHFNIIHNETALRADIYLAGTDPLHAWAFERRSVSAARRRQLFLAGAVGQLLVGRQSGSVSLILRMHGTGRQLLRAA